MSVDLTAEGTKDWFAPAGNTGSSSFHGKLLGGQIIKSFDFVNGSAGLFAQGSSFTISSSASDDATGKAISNVGTDQGLQSASATGFGFRFRVPADNRVSRRLKLYVSTLSATVMLTARLSDGSVVDASDMVDSALGITTYFVWTIDYQAARDGQELAISAIVTANHGSSTAGSPNVKITAATLQ
jgi:hypothetical protein